MPPLRQAFDVGRSFDAGGNYFSFGTPTTRRSHGPDGEGGAEFGTLIQKVKGGYGYFSRSDDLKLGGGNRRDWSTLDGGELKGLTRSPVDEHLGDKSPVLWEKARPLRLVPIYRSSQPQIMAKYRQEMLELVRGVPESAYELSLRDLVEVPRVGLSPEEEDAGKGRGGVPDSVITSLPASLPQAQRSRGGVPEIVTGKDEKKKKVKKVKGGKKQILRSASMDSGVFLLKMFFPISLRGRKTFGGGAGSGSKVSPKPVLAEEDKGRPEKEADAEWLEGCGEMSRGGSGETKNSGQRRKAIGCYPFSTNKSRIR